MPKGVYPRTKEHRENISKALTGHKHTEEHIENQRKGQQKRWSNPKERKRHSMEMEKRWQNPEYREKCILSHTGLKQTKEAKRKMRISALRRFNGNPENHPRYIDGRSFEPYGKEWTEKLRKQIRNRDNYICQLCKRTQEENLNKYNEKLSVHHIDYDKKNCNKNNLITLCKSCNLKINSNRNYWTNYFKEKNDKVNQY